MTGGGIRPGRKTGGIENVVPGNIGRGTVTEESVIVFKLIIVGGNMCPNPGLLKGIIGAITGKSKRLDPGVIGVSRGIVTDSGTSVTSETTVVSGPRSTDVDDVTSTSLDSGITLSESSSEDTVDIRILFVTGVFTSLSGDDDWERFKGTDDDVEFFRRDTKQQTWGPL